jgi:Short C-terminal domain
MIDLERRIYGSLDARRRSFRAAWTIGNEYRIPPSEVLEGGPEVYGKVCLGMARKSGHGEDENGEFHIPEDVAVNIALAVRAMFEEQGLYHGLDEDDEDNEADIGQAETTPPAPVAETATTDHLELIKKLGELREAGLLTDDEFEAKKAEILARM